MYVVINTMRGGSYDDSIKVNGEHLFGKIEKRVYRAMADGGCCQPQHILFHLDKLGMKHNIGQISRSLQGLKQKKHIYFDGRWFITTP